MGSPCDGRRVLGIDARPTTFAYCFVRQFDRAVNVSATDVSPVRAGEKIEVKRAGDETL